MRSARACSSLPESDPHGPPRRPRRLLTPVVVIAAVVALYVPGYVVLRVSNEIRQVTMGDAFGGELTWSSWLVVENGLWGRIYAPCIAAETWLRDLSQPPVRRR